MSHGVPRMTEVPRSEQELRKEATKIAEYRELESSLQQKITAKEYSPAALDLSSKILVQNPEYYTAWNDRRRIHSATWAACGDDAGEAVAQDIEADLAFILPLMIKYPKCYWIWNFRLWLLDQATARLPAGRARAFWHGELGLVAKMLGRDRRNFHGWRFRRIVVEALEGAGGTSLTQQEFDYTTKMIGADLSNYSAWHYRSKLIPRLLSERGADAAQQRQMLDDELALIHEALIDPYDSSLWFYHQCVTAAMVPGQAAQSIAPALGQEDRLRYLEAEVAYVADILDGCDDCKWAYQALLELCRLHRDQSGAWPPGVEQASVEQWTARLQQLDPLRRGRWEELEQRSSS